LGIADVELKQRIEAFIAEHRSKAASAKLLSMQAAAAETKMDTTE